MSDRFVPTKNTHISRAQFGCLVTASDLQEFDCRIVR